jgi:hypothetical protein
MGAFSTISTILNGSPSLNSNGVQTIRQGTFTSGATTCTMPVGNLSSKDLVQVIPIESVTNFLTPIEIVASRTVSNAGQGVVTVGFQDGSAGPAATQKMWVIVRRNT